MQGRAAKVRMQDHARSVNNRLNARPGVLAHCRHDVLENLLEGNKLVGLPERTKLAPDQTNDDRAGQVDLLERFQHLVNGRNAPARVGFHAVMHMSGPPRRVVAILPITAAQAVPASRSRVNVFGTDASLTQRSNPPLVCASQSTTC
jgi:hypothetical protein